MFSIISTMFLGIGIGYGLRNWTILQKTEKDHFSYHIPVTLYPWSVHRFQ